MISKAIKDLRKKHNLSQTELGKRLGVGQSTVAMWENGKNKPEYETLSALAELFGVGLDELSGKGSGLLRVPVLGKVQAGIPVSAIEDVLGYEELSGDMRRHGEYFALQIRGDSMEPRMREGDVVIVRRQESVENGEIAIVLVGDAEATCKRFYKHADGVSLFSYNQQYQPMFFSKKDLEQTKLEVLGKVVELRARF